MTVEEARARIKELKAEIAPLQAIVDEANDATALAWWVPAVVKKLDATWGKASTKENKAIKTRLATALKAGLVNRPVLDATEEMGKYYDPAWNVYTAAYTWRTSKGDISVTYKHSTNLNHDPETTLTIDGKETCADMDTHGWEALDEIDEHLWPVAAVVALDLWNCDLPGDPDREREDD